MRPSANLLRLFVLSTALVGCSGGGEAPAADAPPERTRAQRDSLLSTLPVPGAQGVGRALDAAGAAAERARQHDTIR
jgi:hypothetical protein